MTRVEFLFAAGHHGVAVADLSEDKIAAHIYQLHVKGTAWLLVDAKKEGIISHVAPYFDGMIQAGYFLGASLVEACLKAANE